MEVEQAIQPTHKRFYSLRDLVIFGMQFDRKTLASK